MSNQSLSLLSSKLESLLLIGLPLLATNGVIKNYIAWPISHCAVLTLSIEKCGKKNYVNKTSIDKIKCFQVISD